MGNEQFLACKCVCSRGWRSFSPREKHLQSYETLQAVRQLWMQAKDSLEVVVLVITEAVFPLSQPLTSGSHVVLAVFVDREDDRSG